MGLFTSCNLIFEACPTLTRSLWFNHLAMRTEIPAVVMLIRLSLLFQYVVKNFTLDLPGFFPVLEVPGIVGPIMVVLETALDLEFRKDRVPSLL